MLQRRSLAFLVTVALAAWHCVADLSLRQQMKLLNSYDILAGCEWGCVAGEKCPGATLGCSADHKSIGYQAESRTLSKERFCSTSERQWMYGKLYECMASSQTCAADGVKHFNYAVGFLGGFCGFTPVLRVGCPRP